MCAIELELSDSAERLRVLAAGVSRSNTREILQSATYGLGYRSKFGPLDLTGADAVYELLSTVDDPLVVSSFLSVYSSCLGIAARYDDALMISEEFLAEATRYRLDFAIPYALTSSAVAVAGLRRWKQAEDLARQALELSRKTRDIAAQQHAFSVFMRVLVQQRRHQTALALEAPPLWPAFPAAHAEMSSCRALVLASAGRVEEAQRVADGVRGLTLAMEPKALGAAVAAVSSVKSRAPDMIERVVELEETAFASGAVDVLVTAYRSTPELLPILLRTSPDPRRFGQLLRRATDEDLAVAAGHHIQDDDDPATRLSAREHEVYELLTQGLTNLQIAQLLFISEGTVKVHVHHVYDKLGIRSRTALAVQAALERSDQATSAIDGDDAEAS